VTAAEALIQTALLGEVEGFRHGTSILTRKDGSTVEFGYRATKTRVAGLHLFVSVGFVDS
jgi:hypothetical protein